MWQSGKEPHWSNSQGLCRKRSWKKWFVKKKKKKKKFIWKLIMLYCWTLQLKIDLNISQNSSFILVLQSSWTRYYWFDYYNNFSEKCNNNTSVNGTILIDYKIFSLQYNIFPPQHFFKNIYYVQNTEYKKERFTFNRSAPWSLYFFHWR